MPTLFPSAFRAHPWHGVELGAQAPQVVTAYIEIVPTDTVKYEIDKQTGLLKIDRPQRFSNVCPSLYGFLPRTLCAERVGAYCSERTGRAGIIGDGDPMDVCVLTEKTIGHGDLLVQAIPIGGLRMIDSNEADDKIIAVMRDDALYGEITELDYRIQGATKPFGQRYPTELRKAFDKGYSGSNCGSQNSSCSIAINGGGAGSLSDAELSEGDLALAKDAHGDALALVKADRDLSSADPVFLDCIYNPSK